jgi:hypothetical protein
MGEPRSDAERSHHAVADDRAAAWWFAQAVAERSQIGSVPRRLKDVHGELFETIRLATTTALERL